MKDSRKKSRSKATAGPRHARAISSAAARVSAPRVPVATVSISQPAPAIADAPQARMGRVVLGTSCTIQEAAAVRAHLLAQAALPGPYEIDGASVERVDTAGIQLLVAFALDCLEKGVSYRWTGRSATLSAAIELLGVTALLESPA